MSLLICLGLTGCPEPVETDTEPIVGMPQQVVTPLEIEFGNVEMGRIATPKQVTISNPGTAPLDVYDIRIPAEDEPSGFSVGTVGGGQRIRPGSQGSFIVELTPNRPGKAATFVLIESNVTLPGEGLQIPVSANAVKSDPVFEPASVEIGDASQAARVAVEIRNEGSATLQVTGATLSGSAAFGVDLDPANNGTLPMDIETVDLSSGRPFRTIYVTFDPDLAEGGDVGELRIATNEWLEPESVIVLTVAE